jgi:uncharacterized protein (TIGR00730 family)
MVDRSDAFVVLPGGLGTLDELFEVLTWKQLRLHDKPIVVVDIDGYWRPMLDMMDAMIEAGFVRPEHRRLMRVVGAVADVPAALAVAPEPQIDPKTKWM